MIFTVTRRFQAEASLLSPRDFTWMAYSTSSVRVLTGLKVTLPVTGSRWKALRRLL